MDLLQDQVKKLYLRFLLPSLGSAMVMSIYTLSLVTLAVVALALWLIYGLGISELLRVMGANDTLFPYALTYMKYINLFLPVAVFSNFIAIFVRADGDPNRAMAGVLLGGAVNIILDIVFIFPLHMGSGGAALASMIGMVIQVLVAGSHFVSAKNGLYIIRPNQMCACILSPFSPWELIC